MKIEGPNNIGEIQKVVDDKKGDLRSSEEELAEAKTTTAEAKMTKVREKWLPLLEEELTKVGLSLDDLPRLQISFEQVYSGGGKSKDFILSGTILGKKDKNNPSEKPQDHAIQLFFEWDTENNTISEESGYGHNEGRVNGSVDGEFLRDGELSKKIAEKYVHIANTLELMKAEEDKFRPALVEENRVSKIAVDLL